MAYFDGFERIVLAADVGKPVYPKDPTAPICACFGLTRADIEQDVREGVTTRTKAMLEKAKSPGARCAEMAANGRRRGLHPEVLHAVPQRDEGAVTGVARWRPA